MAAGNWTVTNKAKLRISGKNGWDLDNAVLKCALVASTSNIAATSTTYAALTGELATANGYTASGQSVDLAYPTASASIAVPLAANPVWTASGGTLIARWAVLYEVGGDILAFVLLDVASGGTDVSASTGNTITIDSDGAPAPVFTLAG